MNDYSIKYLTQRGTFHASPAQKLVELNADLDYANRMLAEAKETGDVRLVRLAQGRIRAAEQGLKKFGEVA